MEKIQEKRSTHSTPMGVLRVDTEHIAEVSKRFISGVVLIIVSIAYGWIGLIGCNALAVKYGRSFFVLGWIIYGISWITYGLGFILAGSSGIAYAKKIFKRLFLRKGEKRELPGPFCL